jgi:hypothetical protein
MTRPKVQGDVTAHAAGEVYVFTNCISDGPFDGYAVATDSTGRVSNQLPVSVYSTPACGDCSSLSQ